MEDAAGVKVIKLTEDAKVMNFAATEKLPDKEDDEESEDVGAEAVEVEDAPEKTDGVPGEGAPYADTGIDELLRRAEDEAAERNKDDE